MNRIRFIIIYISALHFTASSVIPEDNLSRLVSDSLRFKQSIINSNDVYLNFTQLTDKYGYPSEQHTVITEDGYVLGLHRILSKCNRTIGYPVVLMHGIIDSSEVWIFTGPNEGIGYILAKNCYDVWAANNRGNTYSRKHIRLNPDRDPSFWEYSFDDIGSYDLPAIIDYIISITNRSKVYYIGMSQGTTDFFALASVKPEYNTKIQLSIHLAPVVWLKNVGPLLSFLASRREFIVHVFKKFGVTEILAKHQVLRQLAVFFCQISPVEICESVLNIITGESIGKLSPKRILDGVGHIFAGASVKELHHFAQLIQSQNFQRFDEGKRGNQRRYGEDRPPAYNVSLVTSPVVLMCGKNDLLSDLRNVKILSSKLPNLIETYVVPDPTWSHSDYLWREDAVKYVKPKILAYFSEYNNL